jgi:hypothetical protein
MSVIDRYRARGAIWAASVAHSQTVFCLLQYRRGGGETETNVRGVVRTR